MSVPIEQALDALSQAHGPVALAAAFRSLQGSIRQRRQAAQTEHGPLAQTYAAAMALWDGQKADGVTREDRLICLEKALRCAWPQVRAWKDLCQTCRDYGLKMVPCAGDATCGRTHPHLPHEFGTACWCPAGEKFRAKPKPTAEDFTAAGQSNLTRVGRR